MARRIKIKNADIYGISFVTSAGSAGQRATRVAGSSASSGLDSGEPATRLEIFPRMGEIRSGQNEPKSTVTFVWENEFG